MNESFNTDDEKINQKSKIPTMFYSQVYMYMHRLRERVAMQNANYITWYNVRKN